VLLLVDLGILDTILAIGIVEAAGAGPIGLAGELVLLPLEAASINLTVVAAEIAATGTIDVDPLPLVHVFYPDFMPYEP
jgi:hypothetical protein